MTIDLGTADAVWIIGSLYLKTPEALELVLAKLRQIGYEVKDLRVEGYAIERGETTPEQMEQNDWSLWYASLKDIRFGKCKSCESRISTHGIQAHGHTCEVCGEVTYLHMTEGSTIRFRFASEEYTMFGPELNMKVKRWDAEGGWLYLEREPLDYGGFGIVHGEKAQEYLERHADEWELVEENGEQLIRVYYPERFDSETAVISAMDIHGHHWNHSVVLVWEDVEYSEYSRDFPLPKSISLYEAWHWAPLEPSPTLHERIIHAARQTSDAGYYYQDGSPAWSRRTYEEMGKFVRHFTTLDADAWDQVSRGFRLDGPGGIADVAAFCHPDAVVTNEPNIGNFLVGFGKALEGKRLTSAEVDAMSRAIQDDPDTQEFIGELAKRPKA